MCQSKRHQVHTRCLVLYRYGLDATYLVWVGVVAAVELGDGDFVFVHR